MREYSLNTAENSTENSNAIKIWEKLAEIYSIIPLDGKKPLENNWTCWCTEKRPFAAEEFASRNAGIACGPASGVLVLDVDNPQAFKILVCQKGWQVPSTRTVQTGKGYHYYFSYPDDGNQYGNKSPKFPDPDNPAVKVPIFDIRGTGGQVVAEGSIHPLTGQPYNLINDIPLAEPPAWLLEFYDQSGTGTARRDEQVDHARRAIADTIDLDDLPIPDDKKALIRLGKPEGQRSEAIMRAIIALLKSGCNESTIYSIMENHAIGEKYREKADNRFKWLEKNIRKAQEHIAKKQQKQKTKPSMSDLIYAIGSGYHLFKSSGECYARFESRGLLRVLPLNSQEFCSHLGHRFRQLHNTNATQAAIRQAVENLLAKAQEEGPEEAVFIRVAHHDGHIFIDLADEKSQVVDIFPGHEGGWKIISNPPVNFLRKNNMLPLPMPQPGGSIDEFREIINCTDDQAWTMIASWLVGALNPSMPCPLLVIHGEQGSAKSNLSRMCHALIDPSETALRSLANDTRDLAVSASRAWVLSFDNLSGIGKEISDALCRLSTGGGFATRKLYTDADEFVFRGIRPVILNGINNSIRKPDLLNRAITIELQPISRARRKTEAEIKGQFEIIQPRVLGALYRAVATALKNHETTHLAESPRMADFARWVSAAEEGLGWKKGHFMQAYMNNQVAGAEAAMDSYPLAEAIVHLMKNRSIWQGHAKDLFEALNKLDCFADKTRRPNSWPGSASIMSKQLTIIAAPMRESRNIDIRMKRTSAGSRVEITDLGQPDGREQTENSQM